MKRSWAPCLLLLALPLAAQQTSETSAQEKCLIRGMVRFAGTNLPLRRALVTLESRGKKSRQTRSDSQGRFELKDIEPGRYWFSVRREGHVLQRVHIGFRQVPGRSPLPLTLSPGKRINDIVAYFLSQAVIVGRILDAEGEPMSFVTVDVMRVPRGGKVRWSGGVPGSADTNDLGEFRISGLPPGTYLLRATPNGENARAHLSAGTSDEFRPETFVYPPTYYPGVIDAKQAAPLVLRAGEEMPLNLILRPVRAVRVHGRVLGIPARAFTVSVVLRPRDGSSAMYHALAKTEDGTFEFEAVAPGSYAVRASAATPAPSGGITGAEGRQRLEVESGDIEDLTVVLAPFGKTTVQGRVRLAGERRTRPTRFVIHLQPEEEDDEVREPPRYVEPATVLPNGSFELKEVYDGRYRVLLSIRGGQPDDQDFYLKSATIAEEDVLEKGFPVSEGQVGRRMDLLISSAGGRIEGVVIGRAGRPASGAHVIAVREEKNQGRLKFPVTIADQEGRFRVQGLTPGDYKLYAWERADEEDVPWSSAELLHPYEDQAQAVSVNENERKAVELKAIKVDEE
jgi:protocatechuate 3,4-dioxygenase beta subunit